jgi:Flp pilus assembly pilin Flp
MASPPSSAGLSPNDRSKAGPRPRGPATITNSNEVTSQVTILDWINYIKLNARREDGQTIAEYGVVLGVIVLGIFAALGFLAAAITGKLNSVTTTLGGVIP